MTSQRIVGQLRLVKTERDMPSEVKTGQRWSAWIPSRRQWLLATVMRCENGKATLKFDPRYGMGHGYDGLQADEAAMLASPNLFRFVEVK